MTTEESSTTHGRLLPFERCDAAANMAIDEAIAEAVATQCVAPTLRFYGWSRPTLSLGYFQAIADASPWANLPVDIVRRSTGGGAILHDLELTYSLSLPLTDAGPGAREGVYQTVHQCVIDTLRSIGVTAVPYRDTAPAAEAKTQDATRAIASGLRSKRDEPFLCFQRRTDEDLICSGYKILGSAQRRVRGGVLQHGSLLLQVSKFAAELPGVAELTAVFFEPAAIANSIAERIGRAMSIDWQLGELTADEQDASRRIQRQRYAAAEWTERR
ncbi:lipoate--protein ligase family protein [Aporhodopirellula aestuarii]|uniref:Lipoate--protein ligase family protein n=1 Tax=Aporhodopirellula aestuarii TaxID=2950107 RepID=A0ABT0U1Z6_9BACT|nr:lipoate--protein ligase family protein [Aporhodopirellula aestuarii]MCM2370921.1 lipoate--protein ligase family protein [Aporhodopirellula aestuarii]